jgi:hypothetical protein
MGNVKTAHPNRGNGSKGNRNGYTRAEAKSSAKKLRRCDARLAVELYPDPGSESWGFRVPALGIVGGAKTRAAALRQARVAANFTLESGGGL